METMRAKSGTRGLRHWGAAGILIAGLVGGGLTTASLPLLAADAVGPGALEEVPFSEKAIRVRRSGDDRKDEDRRSDDLKVSLRTERGRYGVDDPIRFEVKGNKPFFLYLFNVDPRTGKAVSILPNQRQGKGELKYRGDSRWRKVPNPGLEFYSDRPGTERIVMVASERYLDVDKLLSGYGTKALGADFYESQSVLDWLDDELSSAYSEKGLESKAIRVRNADGRRLPGGVVVDELNLRIGR